MNRTILVLLSGCMLLAVSTAAQTSPAAWTTPSAEQVNAIYPEVELLYIDLHRNPELAMHEQQTAVKLAERMKALGYEVILPTPLSQALFLVRYGPESTNPLQGP